MVEIQYQCETFVMLTVETVSVCLTREGESVVFRGPAGPPASVKLDVPEDWDVDRVADAVLGFLYAYASGDCEEGHARFCEVFGPAWEQVLRSYDDLRGIIPERE